MKKAILTSAIVGAAFIPFADATTVGFSAAPSARVVATDAGVQLSTSSLVLVGNFVSEAFTFNNALNMPTNFAAIAAAGGWKQFTLDTVAGTPNATITSNYNISVTGKLGGSGKDDNFGATKADYFNGRNVYVWIFDAATIAGSSTMGIFKDPTAPTPWTFPTNAGGLNDTANLGSTVTLDPNLSAVAGVGSVTNSPGNGQIRLAPVPEPSTAVLLAVGLVAMGSRRRRNLR